MRTRFFALSSLFCSALLAAPNQQVKSVDYAASSVVGIDASMGYAVHIALDPYESLQSAALGDSEHWSVTARDGTHDIFLKPRSGASDTNLAVRTDMRSYSFILHLVHAGLPTLRIEFRYPSAVPAAPAAPTINRLYTMQVGPGAERITPVSAYDDDHYTYLGFAPHAEMPAVFEVTSVGSERLLNHHTEGAVLVIHGIAHEFVLRLGNAAVNVFNDLRAAPAGPAGLPSPVNRLTRTERGSLPEAAQ